MLSSNVTDTWIKYARNNLEAAIRDMELQCNPRLRPYELILSNCHQSAEKMLKAYLLSKSSSYPQIHDLQRLRMLCSHFDISFNGTRFVDHCAYLNMFWNVKYPDFAVSVDAAITARGVNSAKRIYDFVLIRLDMAKIYFP